MRLVFILVLCLFQFQLFAQKKNFIRVYDLEGNKIAKGHFSKISDHSLFLTQKKNEFNIHYEEIGTIKTKRSAGHNLLIGATSGAVVLGGIGILSGDPGNSGAISPVDNSGEGFLAGAAIGTALGTAIGGITLLFKQSLTFKIDGDMNNWNDFTTYYINLFFPPPAIVQENTSMD